MHCKSGLGSHESQDCSDFDDGQHEFRLAITSYAEEINADNDNQENCDPSGAVDRSRTWPVTHSDRRCYDFEW